MILADTNVWSELSKPNGDPRIARWIGERMDQIWLSTIVIAEIRVGIENPKAAHRRDDLLQWLADIELTCTDRLLPFDKASAHLFGELVGRRKMEKQETKLLDIQIASQAIAHGMTIATRNTRDFAWTGAMMIDPWRS